MSQSTLTANAIPRARVASPARETVSTGLLSASKYYFVLLAIVIARFWLLPLRDGFWLDETGTVWAIQGSLRDVLTRCNIWPSQSPAYSLLVWFFYRLPGPHEVMVRLPSIIAMCVATYLLYRVALSVVGPAAAWPSIIVFALIEPVAFAAADARPYAMAMLAVVGAIFLLVRWLDTGRPLYGLGYCLLASLTVYIHFLFATTLFVHLVYAIYRVRTEKRVSQGRLMQASALIAALLLPLAIYMLAVFKTARHHSFAGSPNGADLFALLAPPLLSGTIIAVLLLGYLFKAHLYFNFTRLPRPSIVLLAAWTLLPISLLYGVSVFTSLKIFLPRYLLPSEAAIALLAGWLVSAIFPPVSRSIVVAALILAALGYGPNAKFSHGGDWRLAMAKVRSTVGSSDMPVLIRSDFPESEPFDWLNDNARKEYLFAPLTAYSSAGNVVPLPMYLTADSSAYLDQIIPQLEQRDSFLLVNMGDSSYENWLLGRLSFEGFEKKRLGSFGGSLTVEEYTRPQSNRP
jgi:mannosyltransferase